MAGTSTIEKTIADAAAAAAAVPQAGANALTTTGGHAAPATHVPAKRLTAESMMMTGISVDKWVKTNPFGTLTIGSGDEQLKAVEVEIDLAALAFCYTVKFGNPATYLKSYDGENCATGGSWVQAQDRARREGGASARPYNSVDIPMTLLKKTADAEVGTRLGYATSTTNWKAWDDFYQSCKAANLAGQKVKVTLGGEKKTNPAGNKWGIVTFKLVGPADEVE